MNIYIENIIADIKRGDKNAFKKLFDDYYPILCVFAAQYIEDKEVCKDIVQEAFLSCWEKKEDFENIHKLKGFLYTVTKNKCLNQLKHAQLPTPAFSGQEEVDSGFESAIIEQETYRMVRKAVDELPSQMRNIILLSMEGLKNHEIADKLQISEGTVHTLKKLAYRKLRETLKGINYIVLLFLCK